MEPEATDAAQSAQQVKLALDTISEERAWELDGKLVTASLLIANPSYSLNEKTVVGVLGNQGRVRHRP